ncbi:hypothetical protein Tco_0808807 [Tanacetum coccineum]
MLAMTLYHLAGALPPETEGFDGLPPDAKYLRNHRSKGIPWCRSKGLVESLGNINYLANTLTWLGVDDVHSLVLEYLKDLEECMDDGDLRVAKEAKLFDALEHNSTLYHAKVAGARSLDAELTCGIWVKFKADFVVLDYVNEGEPSILIGRDFLVTTKSQVDFGLGEIRMNLTKFKEGIDVIDLLEEVGSSSGEVVQMGKENRNKGYNINKLTPPPSLRLEEIPPTSTIPPQPIYHPLTPKQKEKMKEKKLDEILIGKERLNKKEFSEEDKVGIIEHGLPKKMCDPGNYVLLMKINGVFEMVALVDTGASIIRKLRRWEKSKIAIIDIGRDGRIEDDWLGSFEVGRDEDGNVKKIDGDGDWHARFEIVTPSGRKFNQAFKTKTTTRKLSGKFKTEDILRFGVVCFEKALTLCQGKNLKKSCKDTLPNPLITEYEKRNKRNTIAYSLQPVSNANLKWRDLPSVERHALPVKVIKIAERSFVVLEFFSTLYFDKDVDRNNLMKEKCIWFRLCGHEHILTLQSLQLCLVYLQRMRIVHKEESRGVNLAWIIADHLYKHAPGTKENSVICVGHYVTKIACFLGYCVNDEIKKCLERLIMSIDIEDVWYDYFTSAMPDFRVSTTGNEVGSSSRGDGFNDDDDMDE